MTDIMELQGTTSQPGNKKQSSALQGDTTGNLLVAQNCNATVVDVADNSTTISATPAVLLGIYVNTVLSAHALPILDGATTKITLLASLAAGTNLVFPNPKFTTSLIVDPNDAATGNITVFWRAL